MEKKIAKIILQNNYMKLYINKFKVVDSGKINGNININRNYIYDNNMIIIYDNK